MIPIQGRPINKKTDTAHSGWHSTPGKSLNGDGSGTEWPDTDVIGRNPPFLGGSKKQGELVDAYFKALAPYFAR
jgi:hypothetical protein